ncbi:MAG: aspartate aminotransferase family protein [Crocinitomicaceae bacterium]|nr:aspartate aminotransferase family protein [Crocinitomicaceae bacterium]|tara:strand:+ start:727 stop:2115 length:1389 start_codon:yes stop_codon:yes gene_type:complete
MNKQLANDLSQLDSLLNTIKEQGLDFLSTVNERPTSIDPPSAKHEVLPENGIGALEVLKAFNNKFEPLIVGSSGPRYWGYVIGGATPASVIGDWLTTIYDQCPFVTKGHGDLSAIIEQETIAQLLELFELPNDFTGGFVTGATLSNFTCLATARQWVGTQNGEDIAKKGVQNTIPILSASPHSSVVKSLSLLGLGSTNIIAVQTMEGDREAIDISALKRQIEALNGQPFILISSAGTVNTVDFDDFEAIAQLKQQHNFWWHIDAAFGGFAACSSSHKQLIKGWENADSITLDCHKWLNVPYESAVFLVKKAHQRLQVETFQNSNAPYLGDQVENFNFINFLPENSRRLKALPAWFSINAYGKSGYRDIVDNCIAMANRLGDFIVADHRFELLAPVRLNTVCFTLSNPDDSAAFLNQLNATGKVFMSPTVFQGKKGIRAAFVNWRTTSQDVDLVIELMKGIVQ